MTSPTFHPKWIHALRPGTWQGMHGETRITPEDIQRIADAYDPAMHEAPVVLGHPKTDDPAWGWVREASARPDGLWLNTDLVPEMAELFQRGLYKKVSVSLYPSDSSANPKPGGFALKHLGVLGAQAPAVKGLQSVVMSEAETLELDFNENEQETPMAHQGNAPAPAAQPVQLTEQQLADEKRNLDQARQAIEQRERKLRQSEWGSKIETHVQAGKILPAEKPLMLAFMEHLHEETVELNEGEGQKPLLDEFLGFLEGLPQRVPLKEVAPGAEAVTKPQPVNFQAPAGFTVDQAGLEFDQKVQAYRAKHPHHTYLEAVKAVSGGQA